MTAGITCNDCFMASTHDWPFFHAGCVGCLARALGNLNTPRTEPKPPATEPKGIA